ncbi:sensor histidine kinase [Candidatus Sulfurimonas baltica]|uniref:histidine kinase n=1 Tax=Candidatus Sulfurimonas baltica TaxID=2740404 RepID=A0A7S7LXV9_9BACT|nr:HAMP domain-containing sensor histidine kinase [Candidatus Sulfurimonas baltica]QOY53361.1 HAMP domain-containing histidine kinase [Candidatus Sulfurimonas baltica]
MEITNIADSELLKEIGRRFEEKKASILEMEFMTKKLLELNEKNKNSQEVKSQFLSLIKNEFNNPMSSLLNISNMIVKKTTDPKIEKLSSMMQSELLKLDFSLKNIFAASEIEAGETANDYSDVDIESIFNEKLEYFNYLIEEKSLKLKYVNRCQEKVISDSQKINIILLNLISNACEYSYNNSEVVVTVDCDDKNYIIKVKDSGEGVYEEHTKEIYNRFTHFETGNTRATAGLGLGLSVTRGMVEALDGTIDNTIENGKTVFTVLISKIDETDMDISTGIGSNEFLFDQGDGSVEF